MKKYLLSSLFLLIYSTSFAQTARISLEHNGTTTIFTTLQDAYNAAVDDDVIVLPGGNYNIQDTIKKRIKIIGAGFAVDSSSATGITSIPTVLKFTVQSIGSVIEGIYFSGNNNYLNPGNGYSLINLTSNISILNCRFSASVSGGTNSIFKNCIMPSLNLTGTLSNCIITGGSAQSLSFTNSIIKNCIFLTNASNYLYSSGCSLENNIFTNYAPINLSSAYCNNQFKNNLIVTNGSIYYLTNSSCSASSSELNTITVANLSDIFINYNSGTNILNNNYELKSTCPGKNAGTDGTDVGIYGSCSPRAG